jgi:hypothetical protein
MGRAVFAYQSRLPEWSSAPGQSTESSRSSCRRPCGRGLHLRRDTTTPRYTTGLLKALCRPGRELRPFYDGTCTESELFHIAERMPAARRQSTVGDGVGRTSRGPLLAATRNRVTASASSTPYPGAKRTESRPAKQIILLDGRACGTLPMQLHTPKATSYSQPVLLCVSARATREKRPYVMLYFRKTSVESWVCG